MGNGLTGASALAYQGTNAPTPPNITVHYNRPTPNYYQGFSMGDLWIYRPKPPITNNNELWVLMGVAGNVANWVLISNATGPIFSLTGNIPGAPVYPTAGNINIIGDGTLINVTDDPSTSTLNIVAVGTGLIGTLTGNEGGPISPTGNNVNIVGDGVTVNVDGDPATSTLTISALGSGTVESFLLDDTNVITPNGSGQVTVHGGNNIYTDQTVDDHTITINVSGTTNHALQVGNVGGSLTSLAVATNGQLPIGNTGNNPTIATLTAGTNISITNGAGSITIAANSGAQVVNYTGVNHAASPYTVLSTDYYIAADVTGGVVSLLFPNAPSVGRIFVVKDKVGLAATSNITITTVGGAVNIDGSTSFVMNTAYESVELIFNGTSYEIF